MFVGKHNRWKEWVSHWNARNRAWDFIGFASKTHRNWWNSCKLNCLFVLRSFDLNWYFKLHHSNIYGDLNTFCLLFWTYSHVRNYRTKTVERTWLSKIIVFYLWNVQHSLYNKTVLIGISSIITWKYDISNGFWLTGL